MMTLRNKIKDDLKNRILRGRKLPGPLNLDNLAKMYEVSTRPVRQAVSDLVKQGILIKLDNGRLQKKSSGQPVSIKKSLLKKNRQNHNVEKIIFDGLIKKSMRGASIYIREEVMAKKYGLGRTAIRNIFQKLVTKQILHHEPRKGWKLRPFIKKDLCEFLDVREVLELKALDLAWDRLNKDTIEIFLKNNYVDNKGKVILDNQLHGYIINLSENRYIHDFFQQHGPFFELLFKWEEQNTKATLKAYKYHQQILKAILRKNKTRAKEQLAAHIHSNPFPVLKT